MRPSCHNGRSGNTIAFCFLKQYSASHVASPPKNVLREKIKGKKLEDKWATNEMKFLSFFFPLDFGCVFAASVYCSIWACSLSSSSSSSSSFALESCHFDILLFKGRRGWERQFGFLKRFFFAFWISSCSLIQWGKEGEAAKRIRKEIKLLPLLN